MARSRREQREQVRQTKQSKVAPIPTSDTQARNTPARDAQPQRPALSPESSAYRELVAIAAYYRAERRGFAPGGEVDDWLQAEREVAAWLNEPPANLVCA